VAIELGLLHGGYCPKGRLAEDGQVPERYRLTETASSTYPPRTIQNILEADATLILTPEKNPRGGTRLTAKIAHDKNKPWLAVNPYRSEHVEAALHWLLKTNPEVLNVAGPRESRFPGLHDQCVSFLRELFKLASQKKLG
jgi:hypothetical protein